MGCKSFAGNVRLEIQDAEKRAALEEKRNLAAVCLRHVLCALWCHGRGKQRAKRKTESPIWRPCQEEAQDG